ncbi:MAG: hypothetical protein ABI704_08440, partial [Kofleriaceae bacterium]
TLSNRDPVNIKAVETLAAKFLIVVLNARIKEPAWPECYVLTVDEARQIIHPHATRPWIPVAALKPHRDQWALLSVVEAKS